VSKASPSMQQSSFARRNRRLLAAIEGLESRAYLNGVVFGTPVTTSAAGAGIAPMYTDLVDLNGDGKADLITSNVATGANSISILLNNPNGTPDQDGTFSPLRQFPVTFSPLTIVDGQNQDGSKVIAVGSTSDNSVEVITEATVSANPAFTAQTLTTTNNTLTNTQSITLGDFFGNGLQDIAAASFDSNSGASSNNVAIFRNNGDGTFTDVQTLSVPHAHVASITSFKQANGVVDLAVADSDDNKVTVLMNNGSGAFSVSPTEYAVGSTPVTIKSGEFNQSQNTFDDLVTANATGASVTVLLGDGNGGFAGSKTTALSGVAAGGGPLKVRVANLNADNNPDLLGLLPNGSNGDAEVLLGNGDGTFHVGSIIPSTGDGQTKTSIAAGDLAGSGLTGLVLADKSQVIGLVNVTNQDHTPPTATVSSATTSGAGSDTIQFVVNYSDNTQIDATTINSNNITVTDPSGAARPVTLVSSNLGNGALVSATYSIPATGGALGPGDNGAYTVTATSDAASAVKDANGNPVAGGQLGTFTVAVSTNGPNLVAGAVKVRFAKSIVSGITRTAGASVPVVNSGNALAAGKIVINLFANTDPSTINGGTQISSITRNVRLRPGARTAFAFPAFKWPAGLSGNYFLVAQVNATNTVAETTPADNIGASATAASVAAPFVTLLNLWNGRIPASFKLGRRVVLSVLEQNTGNVTAKGAGTATVQASPDGQTSDATTLATVPVHILAAAGHKQAVPVAFTVPSSLPSGTYKLIVTISFPGDTNTGDDLAVSSATVTV
jgi:hypothetical protein